MTSGQSFVHAEHPGPCPVVTDAYLPASRATKLRILNDDSGVAPWQVDGVDEFYHFTEEVWNFDTHAEAVAALPAFAATIGLVPE